MSAVASVGSYTAVSGTVTWNGSANINLSAPNDGDAGDFEGLLLYLPYTNDSAVTW